jgi:tetratricopeptide (TPR) repeat protein
MLATAVVLMALFTPADERLELAREHLAAGRAEPAVELLQALIEEQPEADPELWLLMGEAQLAAGRPRETIETLAALAEAGEPRALLLTGRAFRAWGDRLARRARGGEDAGFAFGEARAHLERAAVELPETNLELGFLELYQLGDHEAALSRAAVLIERDKEDGEALLLRGCAGLYVSIAAGAPGDEPAQEAAARARADAIGDLLEADRLLGADRVEPWVQLAWLYEADDQPLAAVDAALAVLDRNPDSDFTTLYHLARRYAIGSHAGAAAKALSQMAERDRDQLTWLIRREEDPTAAAVELSYAVAPLEKANRRAQARDTLAPIVAARPEHADPWNNYAFLCRETAQYEEAYAAYEQALAHRPDDPRLLNDTGLVLHYYLHRDYDRALELYEQAIEAADRELAGELADETERADIELARRDALHNLEKLAAGDHTWP